MTECKHLTAISPLPLNISASIPIFQSSIILSPAFQNTMFIANHLTISSTHFIRLFSASLRCLNSLPKPPLIFHKIIFKRFSQLRPLFIPFLSYCSPCIFLSCLVCFFCFSCLLLQPSQISYAIFFCFIASFTSSLHHLVLFLHPLDRLTPHTSTTAPIIPSLNSNHTSSTFTPLS